MPNPRDNTTYDTPDIGPNCLFSAVVMAAATLAGLAMWLIGGAW